MKRLRTILLLLSLAIFCVPYPAYANHSGGYSDTVKFEEEYSTEEFAKAESPRRVNGASDWTLGVTSKGQQVRTTGTRPHWGTDFGMSLGQTVYSIMGGGTVYDIASKSQVDIQLGYVTVKYNVKGKIYYISYLHITPDSSLKKGDSITVSDPIGTIHKDPWPTDDKKGYPPHLHMHRVDEKRVKSIKLYNFYIWQAKWNYGNDLDYFTNPSTTGNTFSITGYSCNNCVSSRDKLNNVDIWYQVPGKLGWTKGAMTFTSNNRYTFDFGSIKYKENGVNVSIAKGMNVQFYVVGYRYKPGYKEKNKVIVYRHSLWPQKYEHAPDTPAIFQKEKITIEYRTHTIK
ncbi:M23 family metallopeptidase [Paenibacillus kobensis]|uniref:peptidoglycan DD-metalloendopeptidase family protein n=1 Tax=Paenibacillus kobensis TaxID=59841 RepID=UPI000FDAA770|nr:peptidoglycan DD-metalloendopeptidase family protein [Paenibacillus kobensis]